MMNKIIQRTYQEIDVSHLTLTQVQDIIEKEHMEFAGDYGFEVKENVTLVCSQN